MKKVLGILFGLCTVITMAEVLYTGLIVPAYNYVIVPTVNGISNKMQLRKIVKQAYLYLKEGESAIVHNEDNTAYCTITMKNGKVVVDKA